MSDVIINPWITGIGGGIISSLIVFFVTRYFFEKRERREYLQKIETANNEILYSVRPLIIEKKIPSREILSAIKFSTAKKHGVKQEDLYNEYSLSNDLINEIMANSFLSSDQKIELSNLLQTLKEDKKSNNEKDVEIIYLKDKDNYSKTSILMALMSFAIVLIVTFIITPNIKSFDVFGKLTPLIIIAISIPILMSLVLYPLRKKKEKIIEKSKEKGDESSEKQTVRNDLEQKG